MRFRSHQSWFPKEIDLPNDYEDASARSEKAGRAVIADGVSSAIFSRTWARLLTRTAVANPPPVTDDAALMQWVGDLQKLWREGINFKALPWNLKPKAASTGAQATLLFIEIEPGAVSAVNEAAGGGGAASEAAAGQSASGDGETGGRCLDKPAEYRLRAHALGDCNLFLIRDGGKILSFPMSDSASFAAPPEVFSSIAKGIAYAGKFQHLDSRCREGDLLVACTDAIGLWAMQEYEAGRQVDWMRYWGNDEAWQADIRHHRALPAGAEGRMRIDDCTLLLLQVVAETADESEPDMQPDRSDEVFVLHGAGHTADGVAATDAAQQFEKTAEPGVPDAGAPTDKPTHEVEAEKASFPGEPSSLPEVVGDASPAPADEHGLEEPRGVPEQDTPDIASREEEQPVSGTAVAALDPPSVTAEVEKPAAFEDDHEKTAPVAVRKSWFNRFFAD